MLKAVPLDPKILKHCAAALRTLSHPDRLRIVEALEQGPLDVSDLTTRLRRPQATVSQHLKELKSAGIIQGSVQGPKTCYCLSASALALLKATIAQLQTPADPCC